MSNPNEDDFSDRHDQQRALGMDGGGKVGQVADMAEEAGVLDDDAGGLVVDQRQQAFIALYVGGSRNHLEPVEAGVGRSHVAIVRMQSTGQNGTAAPRSRGSPS